MIVPKPISSIFQILLAGCLASDCFSAIADNQLAVIKNYLDPAIQSLTVDQGRCFAAAPKAILMVEPVVSGNGQRFYNISQISNETRQRLLYAKSMDEQIKDHQFIGKKFCRGIISVSNMNIPFTKDQGIQDENDGLLLHETLQSDLVAIIGHLVKMISLAGEAANGTVSSTELYYLNLDFQRHLAAIDVTAINSRLNAIKLLDGSIQKISIPYENGERHLLVELINATTGLDGLNIANLHIDTNSAAQDALGSLNTASAYIRGYLNGWGFTVARLKAAAKEDAVITMIDVTTDHVNVQRKGMKS
ncbi:MAG: hypothetical protein ABL857_07110 [Rickettsiales bacterium]